MWSDPTLADWAAAADGTLHGDNLRVNTLSTDTRTCRRGDVYVALKGPSFNGHDYAEKAVAAGAIALVVESVQEGFDVPQLVVTDTRKALGALAGVLRSRFKGQVIALTGSAGKTSTRAMLSRIFSQQPGLLATEGNFNNDIGVPKTWFRLTDEHDRVLLEMGANAQKEIAWLCQFSRPNVALLLNAGRAHTEGFGGLAGVRKGKGEIIAGTATDGAIILNRDDPAYADWLAQAGERKVMTFGRHADADVTLLSFEHHDHGSDFTLSLPDGDLSVHWPLMGEHMAMNAAAAAATAWMAGVSALDIAQGLCEMDAEPGRLEPVVSEHGGALIHDAYNANPESFRAGIDVLSGLSDDTLLVAGHMAELGEDAERAHKDIGNYARGKVSRVFTVGAAAESISKAANGRHFANVPDLLKVLSTELNPETAILVKGSRSAGLERVVDALRRKD